MILYYFLFFLLIIGLSVLIFFIFAVLFPAMNTLSFSVDAPSFYEKDISYIAQKETYYKLSHKRAVVLCSPEKQIAPARLHNLPGQSCYLIHQVYGSLNDCNFSCIGLGDCRKSCPQEAIIIENGVAVITSLCIGCGKCLDSCPKKIIKLFNRAETEAVLCTADEHCLTSCSDCRKVKKIPNKYKKGFKFWQSCYRMIQYRI